MGKKSSNKRSRSEEEEEEEIDPDILAEIEAFRDLQKEKYPQVKSLNIKEGLVEKDKQEEHETFNTAKKSTYNKDGLLRCIENMDTANLPFLETMRICRYNVEIPDENDDLQREVLEYLYFLSSSNTFIYFDESNKFCRWLFTITL